MTRTPIGTALRNAAHTGPDGAADVADAELIQRFASDGDETAFAALVRRYGQLVWAVCRRTLGHDQDAEDAFQATFLVLSRKAGTVGRQAIGGWMYGVARRIALAAKRRDTRRQSYERRKMSANPEARDGARAMDLTDALAVVDEEVERLPERTRAAFVLCCLGGLSTADAGRRLGLTAGAVAVILTRARKQLRARLTKRGVTLTSALAGLDLARTAVAAPPGLVRAAIKVAAVPTPGTHARAAALADGAIKAMRGTRAGIASILFFAIAVSGAALSAGGGPSADPPAKGAPEGSRRVPAGDGVAWGKPIGGLQAGIGYRDGARRAYEPGELVPLVVKVRNVGTKPVTLRYRSGFFDEVRPDALAADGKPVTAAMPPANPALRPTLEQVLGAGEVTELGEYRVGIDPGGADGKVRRATLGAGSGEYTLGYSGFAREPEALATGPLALVVAPAGPGAKPGAEVWPPVTKGDRLVGHWQDAAGGVRVLRPDGTGENPDGSKFRWYSEGDFLVAQVVGKDGPVGATAKIPVLFSADGLEHATLLGGDHRTMVLKLAPDGRPAKDRTRDGRKYPREPVAPEEGGPEVSPVLPEAGRETPPKDGPVRVGTDVQVSRTRPDLPHSEVILAADPRDPKRLVAASMCGPDRTKPRAGTKVIVYASGDGGATREPTLEPTGAEADQYADPTFAFGRDGDVLFGYMAGPGLDAFRPGGAGRLEFTRSADGGRTWGRPTRVDVYQDRPFLARDGTDGKYRGRVYCVTQAGAMTSTDGGKSFGPVLALVRRAGHEAHPAGNAVVLSDGTAVALYGGVRAGGKGLALEGGYLAVRRTSDGGGTFSEETEVAAFTPPINPPSVAADGGSKAFRDHIYVVWEGRAPGRGTRVLFARSTDKGATFSVPAVVSEQPEAAGARDHAAFLPTVAVNADGVVAVTWYDTRGVASPAAGWDVRFRASADGGKTWLPSVRVSAESTRHDPKKKLRFYIGHTAGLVAAAGGTFHCLWADGRTGTNQVWTAAVTVRPDRK